MISIQLEENKLFEQWKQTADCAESFNEDGVIDPGVWIETKPKIVFVLKETNGLNGDLRSFLRKGESKTYHRTWNNIVRWAEVLLFGQYSISLENERRRYVLSHICAINLKKQSGDNKAEKAAVRKAAQRDRHFIKQQLSLYQPDVVIACGFQLTADALRDIVYEDSQAEWRKDINQLYYYKTEIINKKKPIYVISMPHPNRSSKTKWSLLLKQVCEHINGI